MTEVQEAILPPGGEVFAEISKKIAIIQRFIIAV